MNVVTQLNPCISPPQLVQSYMQYGTFRVASLANARAFLISSNFFRRLSSVSGTVGSFCSLQIQKKSFWRCFKVHQRNIVFHSSKMFVDINYNLLLWVGHCQKSTRKGNRIRMRGYLNFWPEAVYLHFCNSGQRLQPRKNLGSAQATRLWSSVHQ